MFPAISTNSPMASLLPVIFIICVGMGKELYLEIKRWKEDKKLNTMPVAILKSASAQSGLHYEMDEV